MVDKAMKSLAERMQIKPNMRLLTVNVPDGFADTLGALPDGATLTSEHGDGGHDGALIFCKNKAEVDQYAPQAIAVTVPDGLIWIMYPKKGQGIDTDINRDTGWDAVTAAGLRGVRQVSVDATWSALRWRPTDAVKSRK